MTPIEEELIKFLRAQAEADLSGKLQRIEDAQTRLYDLFLRQEEEHKATTHELRGEIRGLSLRVGAVERGHATIEERTRTLERRAETHEDDLETSQRWIVGTLETKAAKADEKITFLKRNGLAIVASIVALISTVYHFFRK